MNSDILKDLSSFDNNDTASNLKTSSRRKSRHAVSNVNTFSSSDNNNTNKTSSIIDSIETLKISDNELFSSTITAIPNKNTSSAKREANSKSVNEIGVESVQDKNVVYVDGSVEDFDIPEIPEIEEEGQDKQNSVNQEGEKKQIPKELFQGVEVTPLYKLFYCPPQDIQEKDKFWDWNLEFSHVGRKYQKQQVNKISIQ